MTDTLDPTPPPAVDPDTKLPTWICGTCAWYRPEKTGPRFRCVSGKAVHGQYPHWMWGCRDWQAKESARG